MKFWRNQRRALAAEIEEREQLSKELKEMLDAQSKAHQDIITELKELSYIAIMLQSNYYYSISHQKASIRSRHHLEKWHKQVEAKEHPMNMSHKADLRQCKSENPQIKNDTQEVQRV
jgi:hypothetical protein